MLSGFKGFREFVDGSPSVFAGCSVGCEDLTIL